jgi:uncharacterized repeat protein (TIGR03803 family)
MLGLEWRLRPIADRRVLRKWRHDMKSAIRLLLGSFLLAGPLTAQTFKTLHRFDGHGEGSHPPGLVLSGNILYGTTSGFRISDTSTVFAINTDGTGFRTIYSFRAGADGTAPHGLTLSGDTLYGTAYTGGSFALAGIGEGTVFGLNTDGSDFRLLHSFTGGSDGGKPCSSMILSGSILYGTTEQGGSPGIGTVFAVNTNGTGFRNLHRFSPPAGAYPHWRNDDGIYPETGLLLARDKLYGTACIGGTLGYGTLFAVNTDGSGFTNLHNFTGRSDGGNPCAVLVLSSGTLYGTTSGEHSGFGTVFAIQTDGTGFTTLHKFSGGSAGANPDAVILSDNALYGVTHFGGIGSKGRDHGTVFKVNTDGTGFKTLYRFSGRDDGTWPHGPLILSTNTLYGATIGDYGSDFGSVFSLSLGL